MPIVKLFKVEAPEKVLPHVPFNIKWTTIYLTIPFVNIVWYAHVKYRDVEQYSRFKTRPWFFIGSLKYFHTVQGLDEDIEVEIGVGYSDEE